MALAGQGDWFRFPGGYTKKSHKPPHFLALQGFWLSNIVYNLGRLLVANGSAKPLVAAALMPWPAMSPWTLSTWIRADVRSIALWPSHLQWRSLVTMLAAVISRRLKAACH